MIKRNTLLSLAALVALLGALACAPKALAEEAQCPSMYDITHQAMSDAVALDGNLAQKAQAFDSAMAAPEDLAAQEPNMARSIQAPEKFRAQEPAIQAEEAALWRNPLLKDTQISSAFGYRIHPVYGYWKLHRGTDLEADYGDPIVATRSGVIRNVGSHSTSGIFVEIDHGDGFCSEYLHMSRYIVSEGDWVTAGQVIGYVGATGTATGPHLHMGLYYEDQLVDPADYVNFCAQD